MSYRSCSFLLVFCSLVSFLHSPLFGKDKNIRGKFYVTSWYDPKIALVNKKLKTAETLPVGIHSHAVVLTPDQKWAWVANNGSDSVTVIDTEKDQVVKTFFVGHGPNDIVFDSIGKEALITAGFDNQLNVVDTETYSLCKSIKTGILPHSILVLGEKIWVTNQGSGDVTVIQKLGHKVVATIPVCRSPLGIASNHEGNRIYVACNNSNDVIVIDAEKLSVIARIPVERGPALFALHPTDDSLYVTIEGKGAVQKINTQTNQVEKTFFTNDSAGTYGILFIDEGKRIAVTNPGHDSVTLIDSDLTEILDEAKVLVNPEGIAFKKY